VTRFYNYKLSDPYLISRIHDRIILKRILKKKRLWEGGVELYATGDGLLVRSGEHNI